ncbi:MAG TPA: hypothetical protein VFL86_26160, partial [Burkholderiaceae bacterium]|nr:hypothetical protein [Burkholderiaceae bacterium]
MEENSHWGDERGFSPAVARPHGLALEPVRRTRVHLGPRFEVQAPATADHSRVLLVCALGTHPREIMATRRALGVARGLFEAAHVQTEVLNLTLATAALAPSRGLDDWHAAPHAAWAGGADGGDSTAAHGVLILMPPHWRRMSSALKLLINRSASQAAASTPPGETVWPHEPAREARAYGLVMHGDLRFASRARQALCEWLDWMRLVEACEQSQSHHTLSMGESADDWRPEHDLPSEWEVRAAA